MNFQNAPTVDPMYVDIEKKLMSATWKLWFIKIVNWIVAPILNYLKFDLTYTGAVPTTEGTLSWNNTDHTLNIQSELADSVLQVGQENWIRVVNKTGADISDLQCVYISGAQGNRPKVALAKGDAEGTSYTIGVTTNIIAKNQEGYATVLGLVRGYDTSGFAEGAKLYVSPTTAGALTSTKPTAPNHAVFVGFALNSTNNGSIFVHPDTGFELDELHDVLISSQTYGDFIGWNGTTWVNTRRIGDGTNYTAFEADGTMVATGTATCWNDTMTPANSFRTGGPSLTLAAFIGNIWMLRFDIGDILYVQVQIPHDYKVGTAVYPHLHVAVNSAIGATNYNVEVTTETSWANVNEAFSTPSVVSTGLVLSFQNAAQYTHKVWPLTALTPTATQGGISSYVLFKVERITPSVQPISPATSLFVMGLDMHYEVNTLGSRTEYTK